MINKVKNIAKKHVEKVINVRRYLHANPELSFKEYQTSKFIQSILKENKIPFTGQDVTQNCTIISPFKKVVIN